MKPDGPTMSTEEIWEAALKQRVVAQREHKAEYKGADRRKGGLASWEAHHRIPPGRKKLPRLHASESEMAGQPSRGGYGPVQRVREGRIEEFDFIS